MSVSQFKGKTLVDVREYYFDKKTGEKKPGKKGVALNLDCWARLLEEREAIQAAVDALEGKSETTKEVKEEEKGEGSITEEDKPQKKRTNE